MALTKYIKVTNYNRAVEVLNGKDSKRLAHNTYLIDMREHDGSIRVRYYNTYIVSYYPDYFVLNTDGHDTSTTKQRLNIFTPYNVVIFQKNWQWFVSNNWQDREGIEYYDGITLNYSGEKIGFN